jgi:CMP/dCMP kinase
MPTSPEPEASPVPERFTIALDGPAAAGKSTVAALVAGRLGAVVFDTGVLYRALTLAALEDQVAADDGPRLAALAGELEVVVRPPSIDDGRKLDVIFRDRDVTWELRSPEVDSILSQISALPEVRRALLQPQRRIGNSGRVIMVGRDIGTVVMPDADLKIYLEASPEERARRRYEETLDSENAQVYEQVLEALTQRDRLDSERASSPLKPAADAMVVRSDDISAERVAEKIIEAFFQHVGYERRLADSRSED